MKEEEKVEEEEKEGGGGGAQAAPGCFLTRWYTWFELNEWEKREARRGFTASQPRSTSVRRVGRRKHTHSRRLSAFSWTTHRDKPV